MSTAVEQSPGTRAAAMRFIMITVLIDMVSIGLIVPVLPALVGTFTASQSAQAWWFGAVMFAFSTANFIASPIIGALSDRFGRRPVLLVGFCALSLSFFVTALATALWMLIVVRLFSGAMQSNASVANAYVADITEPKDRAKRFGLLGAMFGLGFILGPVMGGLLGAIDLRLPFFAAGSLALLNLLYGWFVLPESLPPEKRRPFAWRSALNPIAALAELGRLGGVGLLVAVVACAALSQFVLYSSWVLYTTFKFGWGPQQNGWSLFTVGCMSALVQGVLARAAPEAFLAAAPGARRPALVDARLPRLGCGERRLDDLRGDPLQRSRLHGRGVDPEHHLGRCRRDDAGPDDGRGELAAKPDGGRRPGRGGAAARHGLAPAAGRLAHRRAVLLLRAGAADRPRPRLAAFRCGAAGTDRRRFTPPDLICTTRS